MAEGRSKRPKQPKQPAQSPPDIQALADSYKIVGELRGRGGARKYMATRLQDGAEVIVSVLAAPEGAENNELSHFAADVQLLSSLSHPSMARVFESRWIGTGSLAVVSERIQGTTLAEALNSGQEFSNPRTAAVLQEVWGVLDWARASGVVHRGVTPDNVYFEPSTEHVIVALGPTAIPAAGASDANGDARTIGMLAWSMLTGKLYTDDAPALSESAPNLAVRVVDATEAIVHGAGSTEQVPDVPTYVGIIAAGDVLKQAEVELAAMKEEYEEQHRAALASCENHRVETERMAADQAELLASERVEFEETMTQHQEQLTAIHAQLQKQSGEIEQRIAEFEARRAEVNRLRSEQETRIVEARDAREKEDAERREEFEAKRKRGDYRDESEDIRSIVGARPRQAYAKARAKAGERRWAIPVAALAILLVIAGVVGAIVYHTRHGGPASNVAVAKPVTPHAAPAGNPPPQTAGGTLAPGVVATPPAQTTDSATTKAAVDSPPAPESVPASRPKRAPHQANDVNGMIPTPVPVLPADSAARRDSILKKTDSVGAGENANRRDSTVRSDSGYVRDTSTRRDSAPPVDTAKRRDSLGRGSGIVKVDTVFKRDTSTTRRDSVRVRPDSTGRVPPP